ncbi:MAG: hypothetical protein VX438_01975 [Planctomycetota bacterium]|nr:hypothetical protein [Planctomycetota bacterium]
MVDKKKIIIEEKPSPKKPSSKTGSLVQGLKSAWSDVQEGFNQPFKTARERELENNPAIQKADRKVDRLAQEAGERITNIEKRIISNPIKHLGARYAVNDGFQFEPIEVSNEIFGFALDVHGGTREAGEVFEPACHTSKHFALTALDYCVTQWCTFVAIQIDNYDPNYKIKTPWLKKPDLAKSQIYLIDTETSNYYYPIVSTLSGETLAGYPKVGIIAFDKFRFATNKFELHISEVKLTSEPSKRYSFKFAASDPSLGFEIESKPMGPSLANSAKLDITEQGNEIKSEIRKQQTGCGCLVLFALGFASLATTAITVLI